MAAQTTTIAEATVNIKPVIDHAAIEAAAREAAGVFRKALASALAEATEALTALPQREPQVGDRVRVLPGAYYTVDDSKHPVASAFIGDECEVTFGVDGEGDFTVKSLTRMGVFGTTPHEAVNADFLELIED